MKGKIQKFVKVISSQNFKIYSSLTVLFINAIFAVFVAQQLYRYKTNTKVNASGNISGAILKTNYGDIEIMFNKNSPVTVTNFIKLAESNFYDGTRFHRVVSNLLIEGGDPLTKNVELKTKWGNGGPGYVIKDEIHPDDLMVKGTVAMVNNGPNTNGSQFYILINDADWLKGQNTVFAWVVNGFDVVEKISMIPIGITGIPLEDVVIEKLLLK